MKKNLPFSGLAICCLMFCIILPMTHAMVKPIYALNEEDVDGWWISIEAGFEMSVMGINIESWSQTWMSNESWADATSAFWLQIMDFGDMINYDLMWESFITSIVGFLPEDRNITGFTNSVNNCQLLAEKRNWGFSYVLRTKLRRRTTCLAVIFFVVLGFKPSI